MILTFSWHFLQYCEIEDTLHPCCKVWQSDVCLEAVPNRMPLCVQCESMPNHPLIYLPTFVSLSHSLDKVTKCLTRLMTEPFARLCLFVGVVYLKWSHSPPHPSVLIPHPTPPFPPLTHHCPIRSTSRPVLANHTTSKPGGGVKKVTGVGGTTYEISVWVTDILDGLSWGQLPRTWAGYYSQPQASRNCSLLQDWRGRVCPVLTLLSL